MTASASQPRVGRERRIIERPRLIKLLDESDARTILLLAPAGYGKTTLARQWAKTLNSAVWVTLTAAHRDVAVVATELARAIDPNDDGGQSFVNAYIRAHPNPQRRAREVALVVARELGRRRVQWIIFDDYQEIATEPDAEAFVEILNAQVDSRFLIASRLRPRWATARLAIYGDVAEVGRTELALDADESRQILDQRPGAASLVANAEGWPAVIGLAASAASVELPGHGVASTLLHDYLADELFKQASESLQHRLMRLALAPDLHPETVYGLFGSDAQQLIDDGRELGFINTSQDTYEFHPLVRDFLLQKLALVPESAEMVAESVSACVGDQRWERAFELILRFERFELAQPALETAYIPLIRSGNVATVARFAAKVRASAASPPVVVELAEADLALADGTFDLASRIAQRAIARFPTNHHLLPRANTIVAECAYARARPAEAEAAYRAAFEAAHVDHDQVEALRGWALASLQGETPVSPWLINELDRRRTNSPLDVVRHTILELTRLHFTTGYAEASSLIADANAVLDQVEDPRARSSFAHVVAYVTALGARYEEASRWQRRCDADITAFDLDFARPHSHWNHAHLALGLRQFGRAERMLQKLEDLVANRPLDYHVLNARILRARLWLETGQPDKALACLPMIKKEVVIPSIHGEYLATSALAHAVCGDIEPALERAVAADAMTSAVEVRVLAAATRAVATPSREAALDLWELADNLEAWDPVVAAVRASRTLAGILSELDAIAAELANLYHRSNDLALARRAGLRVRVPGRMPAELLSPRELEVLGLLARGYRNRDIAEALVVSVSTVKVHIRHIFEKLGVRTRTEAVSRFATTD